MPAVRPAEIRAHGTARFLNPAEGRSSRPRNRPPTAIGCLQTASGNDRVMPSEASSRPIADDLYDGPARSRDSGGTE